MKNLIFFSFCLLVFLNSCEKDIYVQKFKEAQKLKYKTDQESLKKAIKNYQDSYKYAIEALNGKYDSLKELGIILSYDKKFLEAIEVLKKARQGREDDSEIYYYLGFSYLNLAKSTQDLNQKKKIVEMAKEEFERGIDLDKNNDSFYYGLGILHGFLLNELETSLEYLNQAYALNSKNINILFALANVNYQIGNQKLAKKYYQEVIDNFPKRKEKVKQAQANLEKLK